MKAALITRPVSGPSVSELHGYLDQARKAFEAAPGGFEVDPRRKLHATCSLFANRLLRAPAANTGDILLKLEAADWLDVDPRVSLALIRADLLRIHKTP